MWGILEQHWNATLLTDRETVVGWAKSMTWKGISPVVRMLDKVFSTGVTIAKKAFLQLSERLVRNETLPKWDVVISPL
ncbi:MAG: hypothetical protein O3A00_15400 [Planctomycetota bacterium]|nr:hypothetical protein [Planctomycetota bacterium]